MELFFDNDRTLELRKIEIAINTPCKEFVITKIHHKAGRFKKGARNPKIQLIPIKRLICVRNKEEK